MKDGLVSVVIPAYNQANFLKLAINSVLQQTYTNLEIIVVDDGSNDQTPFLLTDLAETDTRIRYIRQENDKTFGLGARNWGILNSGGEWIALLDQDDLWHPKKIENQLALYENDKNVQCIFSPVEFIDDSGQKIGEQKNEGAREFSYCDFLIQNRIYVSSGIFKRHLLAKTGLPNESSGYADWWLWLSISKHTRIVCTSTYLAYYRIQPDSYQQLQLKKDLHKFALDNMLTTLSQSNRSILGNTEVREFYKKAVKNQTKLFTRSAEMSLLNLNLGLFLKSSTAAITYSQGTYEKIRTLVKFITNLPFKLLKAQLRKLRGKN